MIDNNNIIGRTVLVDVTDAPGIIIGVEANYAENDIYRVYMPSLGTNLNLRVNQISLKYDGTYTRNLWNIENKTGDNPYPVNPEFVSTPVQRGFSAIADLYYTVADIAFIAGGYAGWMAYKSEYGEEFKTTNSPIRHFNPVYEKSEDVDLYLYNEDDVEELVSRLLGEGYVEDSRWSNRRDLARSFYTPRDDAWQGVPPRVQIVLPRQLNVGATYGMPEDVIDSFDFTAIRAALVLPDVVVVDSDFHRHRATKTAAFKTVQCPIGNTIRLLKYASKGYNVTTYQHWLLFEYARTSVDSNRFATLGNLLHQVDQFTDRQRFVYTTRNDGDGNADESDAVSTLAAGLTDDQIRHMYSLIYLD